MLAVLAAGLPGFTCFQFAIRGLQAMQRARDAFWLYLGENLLQRRPRRHDRPPLDRRAHRVGLDRLHASRPSRRCSSCAAARARSGRRACYRPLGAHRHRDGGDRGGVTLLASAITGVVDRASGSRADSPGACAAGAVTFLLVGGVARRDERAARRRQVAVSRRRGTMASVRIVTDSACDLPKALLDTHKIERRAAHDPLRRRGVHRRRRPFDAAEFWKRCSASAKLPETAAPAPGAFQDVYERAADDGCDGDRGRRAVL